MTEAHKIQGSTDSDIPICVDLDDSLIKADSLVESVVKLIKTKPYLLIRLPIWLIRGKATLKAKIAAHVELSAEHLPYNQELLFYLKRMQRRGRTLHLVTGANQKIADAVAEHLGIFAQAHGSTDSYNLTGPRKAAYLENQFGRGGFDYVGDSSSDLYVWAKARAGLLVSPSPYLINRAKRVTLIAKVFPPKRPMWKAAFRAVRLHQWAKNLLIFAPLLLSHQISNLNAILSTLIAFVSFSLLASANYVVNDIFDLESDRQHTDKKNRPFASGDLPVNASLVLVPLLLAVSLLAAFQLKSSFLGLLLIYVIVTNLYTFKLKKMPIADILVLSSLFSMRLFAGSIVTSIKLSPWLLAFAGFLFLSLATIKRCSELIMLIKEGKSKTVGRGYHTDDVQILTSLGSAAGYGAIVVMALYINSQIASSLYQSKELLWLICPVLVFWISRLWFMTARGQVHSDPVKFALTDRASLVLGLVCVLIWLFAWNPNLLNF